MRETTRASRAGIRPFIDIGTGIPSAGNVHEVAGRAAPDTRVVYVDNDPIVHVHANALLTGSGATGIVLADLRDPAAILAHPALRELIDFTRPVALLLVAILHFITDEEDPAGIVATLRDALPDGSYLALSHATWDFHPPGEADKGTVGYQNATAPLVFRTHQQALSFFDGFDLLEPGLVQAPLWRPDGKRPLAHPYPRKVRRDPGQVHAAASMLNEEQHVQATQEHCIDMEEVHCKDRFRLGASRNARRVSPDRVGAGSIPASLARSERAGRASQPNTRSTAR